MDLMLLIFKQITILLQENSLNNSEMKIKYTLLQ
jgi:hypothetical protein